MSNTTSTIKKELVDEKKNRLFEETLLPVWMKQRNLSWLGFAWIWVGLCVVIVTFQYGANAVMGGFPLLTVALVITLANLGLATIMTLTADIGTEHGLSFACFLRAPFGLKGANIPAVSRGIVAACWFGIQSYLGAIALNGVVEYFTGFAFWPLWYILFMVVQVVNVAMGMKAIERLASLAAPSILAISVWMYFNMTGIAALKGINIWTFAGSGLDITLLALFIVNMTVWAPMALDTCNLTRWLKVEPSRNFFKRNKAVFPAHFITLPLAHAWIALIGAVSYIATGQWNPIEVIQTQGTGLALILMLLLIVFAQWSTNVTGAVLPAALTFVNAGGGRISYRWGVVLAGIVGTIVMPWWLLQNLFTFLSYYGGFLGAMAGIMMCDYFIIRKRRLNVPDLFKLDGQFKYANGINPAGMIAWLVPSIISLFILDYAYLFGLPVAFILYYLLMKYWILDKYKQAEVESNFSDDYLATSIGLSWVHEENKGFIRKSNDDLPNIKRVDM